MLQKRHMALLISGVLLICLFLVLLHRCERAEESSSLPPEESWLDEVVAEIQQEPEPTVTAVEMQESPDRIPRTDEPDSPGNKPNQPDIEKLINDLGDDDIPHNAYYALDKLHDRLPDDQEAVESLIEALESDDWQQRQIAGYALARWATHTDLSRNRRFLEVMVEALRGDPPLMPMRGHYAAEMFLCGQGDQAAGLLQTALRSENTRQRTYAAFILAVRMDIQAGNRLLVEQILSDASEQDMPDDYIQGALTMCAMQAQGSGPRQNNASATVPDHVYVVVPGDMLSDIAWAYNTNWRMLSLYNGLPNPNRIEPGLEIFVPGSLPIRSVEELEPPLADDELRVYDHVLYPGEKLEDIARQYAASPEAIMILNDITDPESLKPGTRLRIPIMPENLSSSESAGPEDLLIYDHVVYPGERLEDVASQYGSTPEAIMILNDVTDPQSIKPGMTLFVPILE